MSNFTKFNAPLNIQFHKYASNKLKANYWVVTQPFTYHVGDENSNETVFVPSGFLTDGASVPRALWGFIPPWGSYGQAAVLHDYLCEHGEDRINIDVERPLTRANIDAIFFEAMGVLTVPSLYLDVIKAGIDLYRLTSKPKVPNVVDGKQDIELLIIDNYLKTGNYELT